MGCAISSQGGSGQSSNGVAVSGWHSLPRRALAASRIEVAVVTVAVLCVGYTVNRLWAPPLPGGLLWLLLTLVVGWAIVDIVLLIPRSHAAYRFRANDRAVEVRRGVVVESELLIPLAQVLFVDVRRPPIARLLGLASVRIGTVGSAHDIGPLDPEDAELLAESIGRR